MALAFKDSIVKASDVDKINSMIIFGEYGTGKSWIAASADDIEDYAPVLAVDIEGSFAGVGRRYPNVDIIKADTFEKLEFIKKQLLTEEHEYKTVIFDTLNVAQKRAKSYFKTQYPNNTFAMWDALAEWSLDFVRSMHHADFLSIFIAHPQVDKDDNTGKITTTVKLAGGARSEVPTVPDLIGYAFYTADDEGKRIRALQVDGTQNVVAKNRFGLQPVLLPAPGNEGVTLFDIQSAIITAKEKGN